ncbi:MAG: hypothetical protein FWC42_10605, partial [Proteobacteria bacterium]|nr:hypothetical protein [Pseudomonadota bacterium]
MIDLILLLLLLYKENAMFATAHKNHAFGYLRHLLPALLLAAALGLGWAASAAAMDLTGWACTPGPMPNASCGTLGADGVVSLPATELPYGWVSSRSGVVASIVIPDSIKSYALSATNASRIDSPVFHANAGDVLSFNFNYVTSDGGIYTDFAWARLLDMDGHDV